MLALNPGLLALQVDALSIATWPLRLVPYLLIWRSGGYGGHSWLVTKFEPPFQQYFGVSDLNFWRRSFQNDLKISKLSLG